MLFEESYSSPFKINPQKEQASFFTSVINGNGKLQNENYTETISRTFPNSHCKFSDGKKGKIDDATNTKIDAFSSPFFGFTGGEKEKWRDMQPWSVSVTSPVAISLDELASAHLQKHKLSTKSTASAQPLFSAPNVSGFVSLNKTRAAELKDNLERNDDLDVEVKKVCEDTIVIGVKKLSLQEKCPSSFGRVLCHKVGQSRKTHVFCDIQNGLQCPPQIKPFDFSTPSPDDIVRVNQKLRK